MPRDGSYTPRDLVGKLRVLRVVCAPCGREGHYPVARLMVDPGPDARLTDWGERVTADCPRRARRAEVGFSAPRCAAVCPDLVTVFCGPTPRS